MSNIHSIEVGLLGMSVLTDHELLAHRLDDLAKCKWEKDEIQRFNTDFPGFMDAAIAGVKEVSSRRLRPTTLAYFNFRVQVWALGFDADPSPLQRLIPAGIITDAEERQQNEMA
jgi:hypothetical protein